MPTGSHTSSKRLLFATDGDQNRKYEPSPNCYTFSTAPAPTAGITVEEEAERV